jgi:aspartate/methionine/tyrosine aminotransferase
VAREKPPRNHLNVNPAARKKRSPYMEWAKTYSHARFNLAVSGIQNFPFVEFPLQLEDLELTAPGGYGYEPLLQRLARHAGVPEECVVTATGTSLANHLAMAAVLDPGDEVLMELPVYGPMLDVAEYLGALVKRIPRRFENDFAIDVNEFKKAITPATRLIVLTNLHNPSGALIPAETIRAIGELALRSRAHVLIDEVYLEMLFGLSAPFCFPIGLTFASASENPFIVTSSLTKVYGLSGLRCGWVLASPDIVKRIWQLNDLFAASPVHSAERMSVMAIDHLDLFRQRAQKLLTANRALLASFLDSRPDLKCFSPPAGSVVFPKLLHGDPQSFFRLLREKYETTVVPGEFFEMPRHFRLGISGETEILHGGLERLSAALDEFTSH